MKSGRCPNRFYDMYRVKSFDIGQFIAQEAYGLGKPVQLLAGQVAECK
jgi:hypothetical protein